jgi:high-affinity nickel permease
LGATSWQALNDDLKFFGLVIIALFLLGWVISAVIYRWTDLVRVAPDSRLRDVQRDFAT